MKKELVTTQLAATMAGVSRRTVRRWISSGRLTRHEGATGSRGGSPPVLVDVDEVMALAEHQAEGVRGGRKLGDGVKIQRDGPYLQVSAAGNELVRSIEDLLSVSEIDTADWTVKHGEVKTWTTTMKGPDSLPRITRNWGVTAKLERNLSGATPGIRVVEPIRRKPHLRPKGGRRALIVPDTQIGHRRRSDGKLEPLHDRRAMDLALQIAALEQPDVIIWLGDSVDFAEWSTKYPTPINLIDTSQASLDECYWWLAQFRATCPAAEIVMMEGNHDDRIRRRMHQHAPAAVVLTGVGDTAPALDMARLLALDSLDVQYVGPYPEQYWLWGDVLIKHGDTVRAGGGATVAAEVARASHPVAFGHIHRVELATRTLWGPDGPRMVWAMSPGCMCRLAPGVVPGVKRHQDWQQGYGYLSEGDGQVFPELGYIRRGVTIWRGSWLEGVDRTEEIGAAIGQPLALDWCHGSE